jgi:extracellular elastinolytic metalloproteinase
MHQKTTLKLPLWAILSVLFLFSTHAYSQMQTSLQKLKSYVAQHQGRLGFTPNDISTLAISHEYTDASTGIHHIYASQKINGLTVTNASFSLHAGPQKSVESNQFISTAKVSVKPVSVNVTSSQAIINLMTDINYGGERKFELKQPQQGADQVTIYKRGTSSIWDIPARLVYYNNERLLSLQPAWEVQMMDLYKKHFWLGYVDASTGKVIEKRDLIIHCDFGGANTDENLQAHANHQHNFVEAADNAAVEKKGAISLDAYQYFSIANNKYRVFDLPLESPGDTVQQPAPHALGSMSGDPVASPDGWHRTSGGTVLYPYTKGNNVWAFQDPSPGPLGGIPSADPTRTAYNNGGLAGAPSAVEPFLFDYPVNLANDPSVYRNGAIVNLFYWNNLMHDVFYRLGFTEAAGNFQESPIFSTGTHSGGNSANDAVLAQAQDGGGTNNANFLTTPDGTPGQMQMYLWTASFPDSLVQITSSSTGIPPGGTKYIAVQGSFNALPTDTANTNIYTRPVVNKQMVVIKKNPLSTVGSDTEGCSTGQQSIALPPGNNVQDKIVLIDRGTCSFIEKVLGAQEGGAAGVIIINNTDGPPQAMGGADAPGNAVRIPAVMVSKADGTILKNLILGGATIIGSLKRNAPPAPKRDGDLDNGVIAHEYGHGISTRMTGPNTVGPLGGSEQGGEGWSDFMALYMTMRTNDLTITGAHPKGELPIRSIGNYVTYQGAQGRGIRPTPYSIDMSVNPSTFKDIGKGGEITVPHGVGYIWATMLYEMMQGFIDQYGMSDDVYEGAAPINGNPAVAAKGNNIAMRLILEGIKIQGTSPTFVRQRDAILKADSILFNAQHSCLIWKAFAKRGLGASAVSNTNGVGDEFEAFDIPLSCDPTQKRVNIVKTGPVKLTNGAPATYTIVVANKYNLPLTSVSVTDTLPVGLTFSSGSDNPVFTTSSNTVTWTIDLAANESKTLSLVTMVNTPASSTQTFGDDHELSASNWTAENNGGLTNWTYTTNATQAFSGTKFWFAPNTGTPPGTNTNLRTNTTITVPANGELVFIHKYATEASYDGGVVETSTDGITWTYIPPTQFVRGGYNGIISTTNNPAIGTANLAAFTGTSPGYIVSIARLNNLIGQSVFIRFRFTCDQTGGTVTGGGWWMDDVYVLSNRTEIANTANAITTSGATLRETEGTNARSTSSAFILGSTPLPNTLGNLSATLVRQSSVDLGWSAYNETGGEIYEIERKALNETAFTRIATVPNTGLLNATKQYKYQDLSVITGNRYQYRIKQVHRNTSMAYTNIAIVSLGAKEFAASLYPNPATNVANISIINPTGGKVTVVLFDVLGKRIAAFNGANGQSQVLPIPVHGLTAGTYWVEVNTANDERATLKLVIKK